MQYIFILFVYVDELKGNIQGYSLRLYLFTCNCSSSSVNVRVHLLHQNFSRNYSSIRRGPIIVAILLRWVVFFIVRRMSTLAVICHGKSPNPATPLGRYQYAPSSKCVYCVRQLKALLLSHCTFGRAITLCEWRAREMYK